MEEVAAPLQVLSAGYRDGSATARLRIYLLPLFGQHLLADICRVGQGITLHVDKRRNKASARGADRADEVLEQHATRFNARGRLAGRKTTIVPKSEDGVVLLGLVGGGFHQR